jgi:hypothetical protein
MKSLLLALLMSTAIAGSSFGAENQAPKTGKLLHVVAFQFKPSAKAEEIDAVVQAFRALKTKIPQIKSFEWGTNISPEKHDKGFTHGFTLSFSSEKDRDAYLVHPEHKAFGKSLGPILADVFVIDYWAKN